MSRALAMGLLGLALAGCGGGDPAAGDLVVELGTGEVGFEPLADEQPVPLVAGPQGGHHVWLSLRAEGLASERALMVIDAIPLVDGEPPPARAPVRIFMEPMPDGRMEYIGWPAQLDAPACLVGQRLSVRVTLTDSEGRRGSDERIVVPQESPLLGTCEE